MIIFITSNQWLKSVCNGLSPKWNKVTNCLLDRIGTSYSQGNKALLLEQFYNQLLKISPYSTSLRLYPLYPNQLTLSLPDNLSWLTSVSRLVDGRVVCRSPKETQQGTSSPHGSGKCWPEELQRRPEEIWRRSWQEKRREGGQRPYPRGRGSYCSAEKKQKTG